MWVTKIVFIFNYNNYHSIFELLDEIYLEGNFPEQKRYVRHVLPTPESPTTIILKVGRFDTADSFDTSDVILFDDAERSARFEAEIKISEFEYLIFGNRLS